MNKLKYLANSILCLIIFFCLGWSLENMANAATTTTILSVARGGTGAKTFASEQALMGNGENPITTKPIDNISAQNSANLLTSGAAFNNAGVQTLNRNEILTITDSFHMNWTSTHPSVKRVGNIMIIMGPFYVKTAVPEMIDTPIFTIKAGYRPHNFISATCSNNFYGVLQSGTPPRLDCGTSKDGIVRVQSNVTLTVGTYINLNFIYPIYN
ncbi:MAG: hypothetical protein LBT91_03055 [Bifidobacteriaceae bacterium]|nr:hypothetical protein [Bifidobacteriaceae bacterium]